jgi:hypothetical protein
MPVYAAITAKAEQTAGIIIRRLELRPDISLKILTAFPLTFILSSGAGKVG